MELADVCTLTEKNSVSQLHRLVPIGIFNHPFYGEMDFNTGKESVFKNTKKTMNLFDMIKNTKDYPLEVFVYEEHGDGKMSGRALGRILKESLILGQDGLYGKIEWNEEGLDLVEKKLLNYYSPEIKEYKNESGNKSKFPVLGGLGLTNKPFLKSNFLEAKLNESEVKKMEDLQKINEALGLDPNIELSETLEEIEKIKTVKIEEPVKEDIKLAEKPNTTDYDVLQETVLKLNEQVIELKKENQNILASQKENDTLKFCEKNRNRIPPSMKDQILKLYEANPELAEEMVSKFPEHDGILLSGNIRAEKDELTSAEKRIAKGDKKIEEIIKKGKGGKVWQH